MKPLFLVGYMGCGKSTLGRKLAKRLQAKFADTDALVEEREGASVYDLFYFAGEAYFRKVEREVLEELIAREEPMVISTGGGLPTWQENMERMNQVGVTLYLQRSAEQIARRLSPYGRYKRPRLRGLEGEELVAFMAEDMAKREPFYEKASLRVDCATMRDEEIVEWLIGRV